MVQFTKKSFGRGVTLTVEHLYTPLQTLETALENVTVEDESRLPWRTTFTLPFLTSAQFEYDDTDPLLKSYVFLPFVMPPFQEDFDIATLRLPDNQPLLTEISLAFDQAATTMGVTDPYCAVSTSGKITDCDMDRYTVSLQLLMKEPTLFGGNTYDYQQVLDLTIPGESFGNPYASENPILIDELRVPINPYKSYTWVLRVGGLYSDGITTERLAMPSFNLSMKGTYPKVARDANVNPASVEVQNIPNIHYGQAQTGTLPLVVPVSNTSIDGSSDIQASYTLFDQLLSKRLRSGYGAASGANQSIGLESNTYPWEQVSNDAGLSVIAVPMWGGYPDIRSTDVPTASLPYMIGAPFDVPTCDTRIIKVPDGFVLHHAVAVWNITSYASPNTIGHLAAGNFPSSATYTNSVGIALNNGLRGDDYNYQQLAYVLWTPADYTNYRIDEFGINSARSNYVLMHIPLVAPAGTNDLNSYYLTGKPIYMGGANSITSNRQPIGQMPENFGAGNYQLPDTKGVENFLEVRWRIRDSGPGLADPGDPEAVRIGSGGHWVLLIGKQSITG